MIGKVGERHPQRDLRKLTIVIGAAIAFFGLLLIAIIAMTGWSSNKSAVERERVLVENALEQSIVRILNEQKSVAWWDDAVSNVSAKFNRQWIEDNIGIFLGETYGQDEIYILDDENKPVYAYARSQGTVDVPSAEKIGELADLIAEVRHGPSGKLRPRAAAFAAGQENYDFYSGVLQCARWAGHILSIGGQPAVVTGITICPNLQLTRLSGTPFMLVSVVYINDDFIGKVGRSLLLPDLAVASDPSVGKYSVAFTADDGTPSGFLTWTTRRPGHALLTMILPLVALAVLGTAILAALMLRRLERTSSELADREAQARHESMHDALSGLPNRHHFADRMDAVLREKEADGTRRCAVVGYLDVDRFKDINDTLGHHAGDALIKAIGERLERHLRPGDFLARFGGDEFAILRSPARLGSDVEVAEMVAEVFASPFTFIGQNIRMTASVGLATVPDHGVTTDEIMRHADIALYEAKQRGRDQAMYFSAEMARQVQYRRTIELDLREALEHDRLTLHYQPVISCATNAVTGVEALLRWQHPTDGSIPPSVFIPIAEEAGLMPAVGAWVLERAFADATRWPELEVAINLSPAQFRHTDLEELLQGLVARYSIDPRHIVLEITEGLLLDSSSRTKNVLGALSRMNFKIALDDFGTGYSSLSYLCNFKFDRLKIDRSFVAGISETKSAKTIVHAVVNLGRSLGMHVVAEGVESEAEAAMMRLFGCSEMQGYYFSKPVAPEALDALLRKFGVDTSRRGGEGVSAPRRTSAA